MYHFDKSVQVLEGTWTELKNDKTNNKELVRRISNHRTHNSNRTSSRRITNQPSQSHHDHGQHRRHRRPPQRHGGGELDDGTTLFVISGVESDERGHSNRRRGASKRMFRCSLKNEPVAAERQRRRRHRTIARGGNSNNPTALF